MIRLRKTCWLFAVLALASIGWAGWARAEGWQLAGEWLDNPQLTFGLLQGDPSLSRLDTSPYVLADYQWFSRIPSWEGGFQLGVGDAVLNLGQAQGFNFSLVSETVAVGGHLDLAPDWQAGLGLAQSALVGGYWGTFNDSKQFGYGGEALELTPGLGMGYQVTENDRVAAGVGCRMFLAPEDVQNIRASRFRLYPYSLPIWSRIRLRDWPMLQVEVTPSRMQTDYSLTATQEFPEIGLARLQGLWESSRDPLFPESRELTGGLEIPWTHATGRISASWVHSKYPAESNWVDELRVSLAVTVPLTPEVKFRFSDDTPLAARDRLALNPAITYADWSIRTSEYTAFSARLQNAVTGDSWDAFNTALPGLVGSPQQAVWLAAWLGAQLGRYNYNYDYSDWDDVREDTLTNSATYEQIYTALQQSLLTHSPVPITVCRGLHRFISQVASRAQVPGVKAYAVEVSAGLEGHVISLLDLPDQVYLIDYGRSIPVHSYSLETALQIYQTLNSAPLVTQYVFDENGKFLANVTTPDGRLLQSALTVQHNANSSDKLADFFDRMLTTKP